MKLAHYGPLAAFFLCLTLVFSGPSFGQDDPAPTPAEEATGADAPAEAEAEADPTTVEEDAVAEDPVLSDEATAEEVGAFGSAIRSAVEARAWPVLVGLVLIGLVYLLRRFDVEDRVSSKALPWIVLGLSVGGNLGAALAAGVNGVDALWASGYAAAIAMAGWDLSSMFRSGDEEASESA